MVTSACEVSGSASGGIGTAVLDFGTTALLLQAIDADTGTSGTQALEVLCTPNVAYTVNFDAGQNATQTSDRAVAGGIAHLAEQRQKRPCLAGSRV